MARASIHFTPAKQEYPSTLTATLFLFLPNMLTFFVFLEGSRITNLAIFSTASIFTTRTLFLFLGPFHGDTSFSANVADYILFLFLGGLGHFGRFLALVILQQKYSK